MTAQRPTNGGFALVEILVTMSLLLVVALALAQSSASSLAALQRSANKAAGMQLALARMEQFAAIDPVLLTAASGGTESDVLQAGRHFRRTTAVTVNTDGSRTVTVTVSPIFSNLGGTTVYTNTFSLWSNA